MYKIWLVTGLGYVESTEKEVIKMLTGRFSLSLSLSLIYICILDDSLNACLLVKNGKGEVKKKNHQLMLNYSKLSNYLYPQQCLKTMPKF